MSSLSSVRSRAPRAGSVPFAVALVALLVLSASALPSVAGASTHDGPLLHAPVDGPVIDHFRAPAHRWSSGNRGLLYATTPGSLVRAAADGEVVFAGVVAGDRFVTVEHPFGLRTSVGVLLELRVVVGQQVRSGDVLGTSGATLHLGVRSGDQYLDPAPLLAGARPPARLVIDDLLAGDGAASQRAERALLEELHRELAGPGVLDLLGSLIPSKDVRAALQAMTDAMDPGVHLQRFVRSMWAWHVAQQRCTDDDVMPSPPGQRRIAVLVAGYLSTSGHAGIDDLDVAALGYAEGDVLRMSYRGGRIPGQVSADLGALHTSSYEAAATQDDLEGSGRTLVRLLRDVSAAAPGVPIDVYAHSQGGIVTRLALADQALPDAVDLTVTIATPHQGADIATGLRVLHDTPGGDAALTLLGTPLGMDPFAQSPTALAEGSSLLASLEPPPPSVRFLAIAARGDLVVPARHATVPGHPSVVVPTTGLGAHADVVAASETTREAALALAGLPPGCEPFLDAVGDALISDGVMSAEDLLVGGVALVGTKVPPPAVLLDGVAEEVRDRP